MRACTQRDRERQRERERERETDTSPVTAAQAVADAACDEACDVRVRLTEEGAGFVRLRVAVRSVVRGSEARFLVATLFAHALPRLNYARLLCE